MEKKNSKQLSNMEISSFCSQMAMILHAGISTAEGISIMLEDSSSPEEKAILTDIQNEMNETGDFHGALKKSEVFPSYFLQMILIGEQTGRLDDVMDSLSRHYDREESLSASIRSAITYPLIMISMMLIIVLILVIKVLPIFQQIFQQFGFEMSGFSKGLMSLGTSISNYSFILIIFFAVIILGGFAVFKTKRGSLLLTNWFSNLRFTRDYYHKLAACRFASGLSLALSSGLTQEEGIELSESLINNPAFQKHIEQCKAEMLEGKTLAEALGHTGIFPGLYARMVTVGDRTGSLDDVLQKIAAQYEEELDNRLAKMIGVLEPTLVIALSVIVGLILLSVMLPLMGILSGL
ncbi:MAG: type II secretion system F family protein [Clostridia bacterium]|nr:type II secretion system F family protein [Clostridia bacterium]NCC42572.1 type II secretion system F family protein [Clostridia bacterium]